MGVRFPSVQTNTLVNASVGINTETVVVTTPPLNIPLDFATVFLMWYMIHTVGTTATSTLYRLRRGTLITGAAVDLGTAINAVAGQGIIASGCFFDVPGAVAGQQYSLTCIDPGSTVAGVIGEACLLAFAL